MIMRVSAFYIDYAPIYIDIFRKMFSLAINVSRTMCDISYCFVKLLMSYLFNILALQI